MTATGNQRWREGRASYRPAGEVIDARAYDVAALHDEGTAKAFVLAHHYSGTYPAARFRFGLYRNGALVGVAVFSHPCSNAVLTRVFPHHSATEAVELGRFVLLDEVPGNGETWFLARCFEQLRQHVVGVVSFSDPVARPDAHGGIVFPGHLGTIYQAHNGVFLGRGKARVLRLLPNGQVFSERAISKIRRLERGWQHCVAALEAAGARSFGAAGDCAAAQAWLSVELARVTRPLRHPGNLKYAWALARRVRRELPAGQPYPKRAVEERRAA